MATFSRPRARSDTSWIRCSPGVKELSQDAKARLRDEPQNALGGGQEDVLDHPVVVDLRNMIVSTLTCTLSTSRSAPPSWNDTMTRTRERRSAFSISWPSMCPCGGQGCIPRLAATYVFKLYLRSLGIL